MLKLKKLRENRGMTQAELGKALDISPSAIGMYEQGRRIPDISTLKKISSFFSVSVDYLIENNLQNDANKTPPSSGKGIRIPVLGRVVAGIPIEAVEEILDYEEITPELAATGEFFALKIRGHSMEPRMMEGDVVIVRRQDDVDSGDVAIVLVNGDEATVKRVKKQPEGITLIATNTSVYEPHFYSNKEIADLPVRILGRVVELRGKL
ncbi:S24 family peptidase [uncultured Megasphaera sp.]|uniref:LexA family protein n=1 Tax=uncultured Megasphaera sp. TaxID=165188 RepID=UPI0025CC1BCC|nr:S24 family peptidase [uncultured Megasphaera sp.]